MSNDNKLFEDFAKLAGSAMNTAVNSVSEMKEQFDQSVKHKMEQMVGSMDLVSREEFDVVKAMIVKAREEQESLKKQVEALQQQLLKK